MSPRDSSSRYLARVELVQQIGQIRSGDNRSGRHLAQLRIQKIGFAIMFEVRAGVIEHGPEQLRIVLGHQPQRLQVARPSGFDMDMAVGPKTNFQI